MTTKNSTTTCFYNTVIDELRKGTDPRDIDAWYIEASQEAKRKWYNFQKSKERASREKLRVSILNAVQTLNAISFDDVITTEQAKALLTDETLDAIIGLSEKLCSEQVAQEAAKATYQETGDADDRAIKAWLRQL